MCGQFSRAAFYITGTGLYSRLLSGKSLFAQQLSYGKLRIGYLVEETRSTFDLTVQCHFGVNQCTCLKMALTSKTADHRGTQTKTWDSGVTIGHAGDTLIWTRIVQDILRLLTALVSKLPITRQRLAVERNGVKFRTRGDNSKPYVGYV